MSKAEFDILSKSRDEWQHLINQYIFNRRDRYIVSDRLLEGMTYDELADKYYLSSRQIKRIVHKATEIIVCHL